MQTEKLMKLQREVYTNCSLLLSSNKLCILLSDVVSSQEDYSILLDGDDNECLIIAGPIESLYTIIDRCYEARNSGTKCIMNIDNEKVVFN